MADSTITSANSMFTLSIASIFPVPQTLSGYGVDNAFAADALTPSETMRGVDGHLAVGFIFTDVVTRITLMADSPSLQVFDDWYNISKTMQEAFPANGVISMKSPLGKKYTLTRGVMIEYSPFPDAKTVLQNVSYAIRWESVTPERA